MSQEGTDAPYIYFAQLTENEIDWAQFITLEDGNADNGFFLNPAMALDPAAAGDGGGDVYLTAYTFSSCYLI